VYVKHQNQYVQWGTVIVPPTYTCTKCIKWISSLSQQR